MPERQRTDPLPERIFRRDFRDREVIAALDSMTVREVIRALASPTDDGQPAVRRTFHEGQGYWRPGQGRPALASDDPAVMQAVGRCAAYQARLKFGTIVPLVLKAHPRTCAWCDYPLAELLKACDWATVTSRSVQSERLVWRQYPDAERPADRGQFYERAGDEAGTYLNEAWAALWAMDPADRETRIAAAMYPDEVTS